MLKIKESDMKKIGWFVVITIIIAVVGILLKESLQEVIPSGTLFGLPFNYADLTFVFIMIFVFIIIYLFFKNTKQKIDKKRRLK